MHLERPIATFFRAIARFFVAIQPHLLHFMYLRLLFVAINALLPHVFDRYDLFKGRICSKIKDFATCF